LSINANVLPGYATGDVANDMRREIDRLGLPPGYHFGFGGDVQNLEETKAAPVGPKRCSRRVAFGSGPSL
jgi:multidrug efflux pump subunit AcrB